MLLRERAVTEVRAWWPPAPLARPLLRPLDVAAILRALRLRGLAFYLFNAVGAPGPSLLLVPAGAPPDGAVHAEQLRRDAFPLRAGLRRQGSPARAK